MVGSAVNLRGDDGRKAERTALCVRDDGRRIEAIVAHGKGPLPGGPTLTMLAEMLVSRGCEGALNLDGGPSSGAAWQGEERVEVRPPRAAIRHAVTMPTRALKLVRARRLGAHGSQAAAVHSPATQSS